MGRPNCATGFRGPFCFSAQFSQIVFQEESEFNTNIVTNRVNAGLIRTCPVDDCPGPRWGRLNLDDPAYFCRRWT